MALAGKRRIGAGRRNRHGAPFHLMPGKKGAAVKLQDLYPADEHGEQRALFEWWRLSQRLRPWRDCFFAIPNGGLRKRGVAGRLKAEGVKAGVPDMFLAWPAGDYHGLFIELKASKGGRLSAAQKECMEALRKAGYAACLAVGWPAAKEIIETYLAGGRLPAQGCAREAEADCGEGGGRGEEESRPEAGAGKDGGPAA